MRSLAPLLVLALACASAPETRESQNDLAHDAHDALHAMIGESPELRPIVENANGYVVFPRVREGAVIAGGAASVGVAFRNGEPIGTVEMREGSFGAQVGGQTYVELIVFRTDEAFTRLMGDDLALTAEASATVGEGAAAGARTDGDVAVYVSDESGAMIEASVGSQSLDFEPMS